MYASGEPALGVSPKTKLIQNAFRAPGWSCLPWLQLLEGAGMLWLGHKLHRSITLPQIDPTKIQHVETVHSDMHILDKCFLSRYVV
jgi:hypothetical protein